jgi:Uma2 family endonuclease
MTVALPSLDKILSDLGEAGQLRRFSLADYYRLAELGILQPAEPVELLDGVIVQSTPGSLRHAESVARLGEQLFAQLRSNQAVEVRQQNPLTLESCASEALPDLAVVMAKKEVYQERHPRAEETLLVVEVADESLEQDQHFKRMLYAYAGIPEYWVVNLIDRLLEVHQQPFHSGSGRAEFERKSTFSPDQTVTPLTLPECQIELAKIFPK